MNTTERELLERCKHHLVHSVWPNASLITDIEAYLAKPVQEPIAWSYQEYKRVFMDFNWFDEVAFIQPPSDSEQFRNVVPLYTSPQSREPMSEDEILEAIARGWCHAKNGRKTMDIDLVSAIASEVYHAIKAHHGIK